MSGSLRYKKSHVCTIRDPAGSDSLLANLNVTLGQRIRNHFFHKILASEAHPESNKFFLHSSDIENERKKQVKSGSWIIHPFSNFRIYYEMWMALVFFMSFFVVPVKVGFKYYLWEYQGFVNIVLVPCLVDIIVNFSTGYCSSGNTVIMEPRKIAKHYVFGRYFFFDVVSSIPVYQVAQRNTALGLIHDFFRLLKIVRIFTFLQYTERSLNFLKIKCAHVTLVMVTLLVVHYTACFGYFLPMSVEGLVYGDDNAQKFFTNQKHTFEESVRAFLRQYFMTLYHVSSFLLAVDMDFKWTGSWISYLYAIVAYCFGKVLMGLITVIIVQSYRVHNSIDYKYQAVLNEVEAFMRAHKLPMILQEKMRQYYSYKYDNKYFNETKIEKYISDKLRREIRFHSCKKMVLSVTFFDVLPREILENIVTYLKKEIYLPRDIIIQAGTKGDCMYFLSSGTVSVTTQAGKEICHLKDGDYFGEISLVLPNQKTTATVAAIEICELYKLERKVFKKCLEKEAELYVYLQTEAKKRVDLTKHLEKV